MKYDHMVRGIFVDRPNRFIAHVDVKGERRTVHVKNTGRCAELLRPGAEVFLQFCGKPERKTKYDLISVYKPGLGLVNMDSSAPNRVMAEYFLSEEEITYIKPEFTFGDSRMDFYFEKSGKKCLMEVKGVTLEREGIAYFPDAPTQRGVKHIRELMSAVEQGYECWLTFVVQMPGIRKVRPNDATHPQFGEALREAAVAGVHVAVMECEVAPDSLRGIKLHDF